MSNHELTQIFYDRLGSQDRYLLHAVSNDTFMRKLEDDVMELIETMLENIHHNVAKPFERGVMRKRQLIDTKLIETRMPLERIKKTVKD